MRIPPVEDNPDEVRIVTQGVARHRRLTEANFPLSAAVKPTANSLITTNSSSR
ncbi:MAG: hypothetical protein ACLQVX_05335 [Limisphaerales bacterium]